MAGKGKLQKKKEDSEEETEKVSEKEPESEEEDLEKMLEDENSEEGGFSGDEFIETMLPGENRTPALEKIAGEQEISWTRTRKSEEDKEDTKVEYSSVKGYDDIKKDYETGGDSLTVDYLDTSNLRREPDAPREVVFNNPDFQGRKNYSPERINVENAGRENPFDKKPGTLERKKQNYQVR